MNTREDVELARAYYDAVDGADYDRLADLLAPEFVHRRPDRTLVGRESFVGFMRDDRPRTDTTHALDGVYRRHGGEEESVEVAVRGRLTADDADDETLFGFVDVFVVEAGRLASLRTYTD